MNKINLEKKLSTNLLFGAKAMALVTIVFFGVQTAYAMITTELDLGSRGTEVTELQTYLSTNASIYPSGLVTGYFGQLTKAGVERFQSGEGIVSSGSPSTTGYGRVGPLTQSAINAKLAGGVSSAGDVYAPTIQSYFVAAGDRNATVSWTASEASFGKVYYSTSPIRINNIFDATGVFSGEPTVSGTLAQFDNVARTSHSVNIANLQTNTTYYYLVVAYDASKNVSITSPAAFRTQ